MHFAFGKTHFRKRAGYFWEGKNSNKTWVCMSMNEKENKTSLKCKLHTAWLNVFTLAAILFLIKAVSYVCMYARVWVSWFLLTMGRWWPWWKAFLLSLHPSSVTHYNTLFHQGQVLDMNESFWFHQKNISSLFCTKLCKILKKQIFMWLSAIHLVQKCFFQLTKYAGVAQV